MADKVLNYDMSNEQILIANAIISTANRRKIVQQLGDDNFIGDRHKIMFKAIQNMAENNLEYNEDTFTKLAKGDFGGYQYLRKLIRNYEENPNIDKHIEIQVELSTKYYARTQDAEKLVEMLEDPDIDFGVIESHLQSISKRFKIANLDNQIIKGNQLKNEYLKDLKKRRSKENFVGFGLDIDQHLSEGAMRKKVVLVAGRPSMGKTTYLANCLENWKKAGKKVLFCALESGRTAILDAIMARKLNVTLIKLIKYPDTIGHDTILEMRAALDEILKDENIQFWNDEVPLTLTNVIKACANNNYDICVIDLFEKLSDVHVEGYGRNIDEKLDELQMGAKSADTCMIITSQIRRLMIKNEQNDIDSTRPTLEMIKNAGKYEEVSDLIIFLHRAHYYNRDYDDVIEQIIAKQRRGARSVSTYNRFIGEYATIGEGCDKPRLNTEGFEVDEDE